MTEQDIIGGIVSGEIARQNNNAWQTYQAAKLNSDAVHSYTAAMMDYFVNLRRHRDNTGYVSAPTKPEIPKKWLAIPTPDQTPEWLMIVRSPSELVCDEIQEPAPPPPPAPGTAKIGDLVGGNDPVTASWRYVGLGDTVPVDGIVAGPDGKSYRKVQIGKAGSFFGPSFYYAPIS